MILPDDHDASTKQAMKQAQVEPKTQINNINNTNVTNNNIKEESRNNQTIHRLPQDARPDKSSSKLRAFSAWSESGSKGEAGSNNLKESLVTISNPPSIIPGLVVQQASVFVHITLRIACEQN